MVLMFVLDENYRETPWMVRDENDNWNRYATLNAVISLKQINTNIRDG